MKNCFSFIDWTVDRFNISFFYFKWHFIDNILEGNVNALLIVLSDDILGRFHVIPSVIACVNFMYFGYDIIDLY